jgi:hypothetical protein
MKKLLTLLSLAWLATPCAFSQSTTITSCCTGTANPNGMYGSSDLPRTTFSVSYNAAGAKLVSPNVTLYLGVRCDAQSPQYGNGAWGWANGGTRVTFVNGHSIGFPRQVLEELTDRARGGCPL